MTALLAGIVTLVEGNLETLVAVALVGTAEIGLLWLFRERTSFAQVATRYGLPGFR
jgi:type IV secretory pathway VirB2 component (pilin)